MDTEDFLAHYGVKGMKWGRRKDRPEGTSRRVDRDAYKDAKEFVEAKMYYGEGAGIRRRLIKNTVESKMKDAAYKEAFERHSANQDVAKAASKARSKRKRTDAAKATKKTAKGIRHIINGNSQYAGLAAATIVAGATYAHNKGYDKMAVDAIRNEANIQKARRAMRDLGL